MWTALLSKELRECGIYAGLALLAQIHFLGEGMGLPLISVLSNRGGGEIPFLPPVYGTGRELSFATIGILAAIAFGLQQTAWESWRQTTLFLLHRPIPRTHIFLAKMLAGSLLILCVTALPLSVFSLWAAVPGTHPSPFYWGMTENWWRCVGIALICYLGSFLTGIRQAHWLGSRAWPLISSIVISLGIYFGAKLLPPSSLLANGLTLIGFILLGTCLMVSILETARVREFP